MEELIEALKKHLKKNYDKEEERKEARKDEDYDEEVEESIEDELDQDDYILGKIADIIHSLYGWYLVLYNQITFFIFYPVTFWTLINGSHNQ